MNDEKPEPWTLKRWRQFYTLRQLLQECESIDSANRTIDRLKRIIAMAKKMGEWRIGKTERSFMAFLEHNATIELRAKKKTKTK